MEPTPEAKTISGKYAIIFLVGLGMAGAIGGQWYRARVQQRPLRLWGPSNAKLILDAPLVNAMLLSSADAKPLGEVRDHLRFGGEQVSVLAERDITLKPGFLNVRGWFLDTGSFDWAEDPAACTPEWKYAIDFTNGEADVTLLFAPNCQTVKLAQTGATASMKPAFKGVLDFLGEQFPKEVQQKEKALPQVEKQPPTKASAK